MPGDSPQSLQKKPARGTTKKEYSPIIFAHFAEMFIEEALRLGAADLRDVDRISARRRGVSVFKKQVFENCVFDILGDLVPKFRLGVSVLVGSLGLRTFNGNK